MPRRARHSKARRGPDGLTILIAYSQVSRMGCRDIPEDITLDDLEWAWNLCGQDREGWGWLAFGERVPRPCVALPGEEDPFDGGIIRPPSCEQVGDRCAFKEIRDESVD